MSALDDQERLAPEQEAAISAVVSARQRIDRAELELDRAREERAAAITAAVAAKLRPEYVAIAARVSRQRVDQIIAAER